MEHIHTQIHASTESNNCKINTQNQTSKDGDGFHIKLTVLAADHSTENQCPQPWQCSPSHPVTHTMSMLKCTILDFLASEKFRAENIMSLLFTQKKKWCL